ncbi:MAG TPA: DedA family protein [Candidatus Binataceae bacterium]|nr:DedA family protein [Candidatus Binataceae bacterium]
MHHLSPAQMTDWLATWGYLGVFLLVFLGNLGIPVPEETVLLAAGFMAGRNELELRTLYLVGVTSAVSGDCCGFGFGRLGGQRLFERLAQRFRFVRDRYNRLQEFFHIHGNKAVFMARFIAGARFMAGPIAGAAGMPFWRFLGWNMMGAIVWCTLVITVGYLVGDELEWVEHVAHRASHWMEAALVLVILGAFLYWLWDRTQSASRTVPPSNH